jgi:Flp pilus assembly protein TadG
MSEFHVLSRLAAAFAGRRRARRQESGQVTTFVVVAMIALIGMVAFVVDVARIYTAHRTLQATADAAATAGALELPDPVNAVTVARAYSAGLGAKNERTDLQNVTTTVTTKCLNGIPCNPANTVVVREEADVDLFFARILGIDTAHVAVRSTAAAGGGTPKPFDVMIVMDRSGSMCQPCSKWTNARDGMLAFVGAMNPTLDRIGLAVFAPADSVSQRCGSPQSSFYNSSSNPYVVVSLSGPQNWRNPPDGPLNTSSNLVSTINCIRTGGITAGATAVSKAWTELQNNGRPEADDVIIFMSDGEQNYGPTYYAASSGYRRRPCQEAVAQAGLAKTGGAIVYAIGYDLDGGMRCKGRQAISGPNSACEPGVSPYICDEQPFYQDPVTMMQNMATDSTTFFNEPQSSDLTEIFERVALDLSGIRLVDNDATDLVSP